MRARFLLPLLVIFAAPTAAQTPDDLPFSLELIELDVTGMPGLHSFAWAEHDGKWLFVTGRVDGLHGIIESGAFPAEQANDAVWVVDLAADQVWSRSLDELDDAVADPLMVTNAQYHQNGETLYIIGGYGTDSATGEKITFPTLTALDVPGVIEAVTMGGALAPHLRQIEDERLAVTGGEMRKVEGEYLLFGGHRFDGEYATGGGDFTQTYTEQIFAAAITDTGTMLEVEARYRLSDEDVLHRRDLTVAPSYLLHDVLDGDTLVEGYAMYGGVFQPGPPLPHRTQVFFLPLEVPEYTESSFEQRFAHYTAPALPLFDAETSTMHTTFFGGMAQFYFDETKGEVVEDFLIPFTDDIVTFTHELVEEGAIYETVMTARMPGFLGSNAVLIPEDLPCSPLEIVHLRELEGRTLMGYIVGGIYSTTPNPGWMGMTATETSASDRVFALYLTPRFTSAAEPSSAPLALNLEAPYPNPFRTEATVALVLDRAASVAVDVFDMLGRRVATLHEGLLAGGQRHTFTLRGDDLPAGVYVVRAHGDGLSATRPLVRVR